MKPNLLQTPLAYLKGIGPNRAEILKSELGIITFLDLLQLYPNRYLDKTQYYKIAQLQHSGSDVQVVGKIIHFKTRNWTNGSGMV